MVKLRMQHSSLQYSDTPKQQEYDIKQLFKAGQAYPIKTGTEAGSENANHNLLKRYSKINNHAIHIVRGNWIAIDRAIIEPGTVKRDQVYVADKEKVYGRGHDSVMATMQFNHVDKQIGSIAIGTAHYPTKGQRPNDPNYYYTQQYARLIEQWLTKVAAGTKLGFIAGDFNMPDNALDWSFNRDFTSMADELKAWQNTGHGPIDGFCSYDKDSRVKPLAFNVLDDIELKMYSDHYVCQGAWDIRPLKVTST